MVPQGFANGQAFGISRLATMARSAFEDPFAGTAPTSREADDGLFRAIQAGVPGLFGIEFQTTFLLGGPR